MLARSSFVLSRPGATPAICAMLNAVLGTRMSRPDPSTAITASAPLLLPLIGRPLVGPTLALLTCVMLVGPDDTDALTFRLPDASTLSALTTPEGLSPPTSSRGCQVFCVNGTK